MFVYNKRKEKSSRVEIKFRYDKANISLQFLLQTSSSATATTAAILCQRQDKVLG